MRINERIHFVKEKFILTFVKMIGKSSSNTIPLGMLQEGRKIKLNYEHSKDKWGFIAKQQSEGSVDGKLLRRDTKGWGDSC